MASRPGGRRLVVTALVGGALLLVALASFAALFVRNLSGYQDWPPRSAVPQDGTVHRVDVAAGRRFHVWVWGGESDIVCDVREHSSGKPVDLEREVGGPTRPGGVVVYRARFSGTSDEGRLDITCPADPMASPVYLDPLNGPAALDVLGPWWPLPVGTALAATVLLLGAAEGGVRGRT